MLSAVCRPLLLFYTSGHLFPFCAVLRLLTQVGSLAGRLSLAGGRRAVRGAGVDRVDRWRRQPLWIEPWFGHAPGRGGVTSLCSATPSTQVEITTNAFLFQLAVFHLVQGPLVMSCLSILIFMFCCHLTVGCHTRALVQLEGPEAEVNPPLSPDALLHQAVEKEDKKSWDTNKCTGV